MQAHVNHGEHCLTVTSLRPIKAGEEVLNYYGPHPNSDLLRRYGYVTQKHSRYDVVELSWDTTLSVTRQVLDIDDKAWGKAVCLSASCSIIPYKPPLILLLTGAAGQRNGSRRN